MLVVFLLTVLRNIGAGLLGRYLRGHTISHFNPRKTYEGALVGAITSTALVCCLIPLNLTSVRMEDVLVLGGLVAVLGQAGDLIESMFKRASGAESSGGVLLGQGGVLDTVDSFAFTGPAAYYYLWAKTVLM